MLFYEYATGLSPFISFGKSEHEYFVELIGNFIKDAVMDSCKLLKYRPDTKYRYIRGDRTIQPKDAQFLYDHRDRDKFIKWIWERMDESDSYDNVVTWLTDREITCGDPATACTDLLERILLDIISGSAVQQEVRESEMDLKLIEEIQERIKALPRPAEVPVPPVATQDEKIYIEELFLAYGDAEGIVTFSADDLSSYPEYMDDFEDRRIDFYAAETIRRGVQELAGDSLKGQFGVLKEETLSVVKDIVKQKHSNGYERMLAVMAQAAIAPVTNYMLSSSPYWISGKIKKGVCHHLVNDGELMWVRRGR